VLTDERRIQLVEALSKQGEANPAGMASLFQELENANTP
jgi:hypothetical protein